MKRVLALTLIAAVTLVVWSCNKNSSGPSAGYGPQSLFPTTKGDTWYYNDSDFNDTSATGTALTHWWKDTMVATTTAYQDANGRVYLEMNNPNGWFDGSFISVDANNDAVYEVDSPSYQPYIMFALVNGDGPISQPSFDYSNAACAIEYNQIGYTENYPVANYNCYKNVEVITNCNGLVLEQTDYYVSPGVGVVRIDDWTTDTTGGKNIFFEDYSQTLTSAIIDTVK